MEISTDCQHLCVPFGPFAVVVPNALVLTDGGKEIGRVEARYDFSEVPPELHDTALQLLRPRGMLCEIGRFLHPEPEPEPPVPPPEPKRGFWHKLFGG